MVFLNVDRIDFRPHRADFLLRDFTSNFWSLPNQMGEIARPACIGNGAGSTHNVAQSGSATHKGWPPNEW
jgi:hypothetical protein